MKAFGTVIAPMPALEAEEAVQSQAGVTQAASQPVMTSATGTMPAHATHAAVQQTGHIRIWRYWRIIAFFLRLFGEVILWEVLLRRVLGAKTVQRGRPLRTRRMAKQFRNIAIRLGGVMIKLGQFLSSRVDVLPPEITDELVGLQDQVPVVSFDYIKATVERELGPLPDRYLWFNPEPIAAASFGQVHRAQLHTGERVVVKVQRPNISDIVQTDLSALKIVSRLMMLWPLVRHRANMPELLAEFSRVLWEELDYVAEADHALTFASMFADDQGVYIPTVYLQHSSAFVLTLEDVTSIKLNDYAALDKAGISRKTVAARLFTTYLRQIFDFQFFHADPHPGNIFIYPLPDKHLGDQLEAVTSGQIERPFYLIFIDFGMVGRLTNVIYDGLRETLIAVATRDAAGLVGAYDKLGVLLPDADTKRIEEATRAVFDKIWGLSMQQLQNMPYEEMMQVGQQFSDLLMTMPFQMPQDFIYLSRAVGILSGMCTGLDPHFDPWREMQPFTSKLLTGSSDRTKAALGGAPVTGGNAIGAAAGLLVDVARKYVSRLVQLPALAETVLTRADRGQLSVQITLDDQTQKQLNQIGMFSGQITIGLVFATLAISSTVLYISHEQGLGTFGYILALITLIVLFVRRR